MAGASWTPQDVAGVLRDLGHVEAAEYAISDEIDGEALLLLSADDFVGYGLKKGPALKLVNQLKGMAAEGLVGGVSKAPSLNAVADPAEDPVFAAFVAEWDLDDKAQRAFLSVDAATRQQVINDFAPKDTSRGASIVLMGFLKSVMARRGGPTAQQAFNGGGHVAYVSDPRFDHAIAAFIAKWELDEMAQDMLFSMDPMTRSRVMKDFAPTEVSRGASIVFMGFAKSVRAQSSAPIAHMAYGGGNMIRPVHRNSWGGGGGGGCGGGGSDRATAQFSQQWGFDQKAQESLYALDHVTRQRVINDFSPKDISRGASIVLMGFIKSVVARGGAGAPAPQQAWGGQQAWGKGGGAPTAAQAFSGSGHYGGSAESTGDPHIDGFAAQWSLDAKAVEALTRLDPDSQQKVMSGFAPKDVSRGASLALMGFMRSVAGSGGKGGKGGGGRYTPYGDYGSG